MVQVKTSFTELPLRGVLRIFPLPRAHQSGELFERGDFKSQRFADFARRRTAAIRNDVRGHSRAEFSEPLVDILNGALALVAAGQIDVDVRPLAALLGE